MEIQDLTDIFYGSTSYWAILSVLFAMFAGVLILFRKRAINNANITDLRKKKANRIATKRLKYASQLMAANEHEKFYDEVLRTLWGYVSAKLNIPVERLSKTIFQRILCLKTSMRIQFRCLSMLLTNVNIIVMRQEI